MVTHNAAIGKRQRITFAPATKYQARARVAIVGPPGSGKTFTSLTIAGYLGDRIALIDSERGSASKYADLFKFETVDLGTFEPTLYIEAIQAAASAGFDVLIIDSLSHPWAGEGGVLEIVDRAAARSNSQNKFAAWHEGTAEQNKLVNAVLGAPMHVIATLRSKMEYVIEEDSRGKKVPKKVGLAPVQRDGVEYEFDIIGEMDIEQRLVVTKTRCPQLTGYVVRNPGKEMAETIKAWLTDGAPVPAPLVPEPAAPESEEAGAVKPQGAAPLVVLDRKSDGVVTLKVETETKPSPEMKRELAGLIRDLGLSVIDGGAGKPYLVALPVPVLAVLGLPENSPPQDIKTFGLGAYESILPVLRKLRATKAARAIAEAEEGLEADRDAERAEIVMEDAARVIPDEVPDEERGVVG